VGISHSIGLQRLERDVHTVKFCNDMAKRAALRSMIQQQIKIDRNSLKFCQ
jgi:hypothetical protein